MDIGVFRSLAFVVVAMALLALIETIVPFQPSLGRRRRHLGVNLGLSVLTLALNGFFAMNAARVLAWSTEHGFGLLAKLEVPGGAVSIVVGILILDASTYLAHRLM